MEELNMIRPTVEGLDFLAARVHGRRSQWAEAGRLENLCRLPDSFELGRAVYPDTEFHALADFQRRLTQDLVGELCGFLKHVEGPGAELLEWMLARFQVENIKMLVRARGHRVPLETPEQYLLSLPHDLALDVPALLAAESWEVFTELLPPGAPRKSLRQVLAVYHDQPRPFFLEAALDRGYFQELLSRTESLSGEDKDLINPIVLQEVDAFHLMLVARGEFHYGLAPELLLPLHVPGSGIPSERFKAMLAATDILAAAGYAVGRAIDALPSAGASGEAVTAVDASALEALAWRRFLRLSNRAFRRSHMGLGAVVGYVGIRRIEVANLITLSEGIRGGAAAERIRARLIPRADLESVYV
jgi:vacuolar-type H+-ATPase subunit C/Vma6